MKYLLYLLLLLSSVKVLAQNTATLQQNQVNFKNIPYIYINNKHSNNYGRIKGAYANNITIVIKNSSYQYPKLDVNKHQIIYFVTDTLNTNKFYVNPLEWDSIGSISSTGMLQSGTNDSLRIILPTLNRSGSYKIGVLVKSTLGDSKNSYENHYYREFTVYNPTSALPVEFVSFSAIANINSVTLTWKTATEFNNKQFNIQNSNDGINFNTIGVVLAKGASTYVYTDENRNRNSYYRLEQVDLDETKKYSALIFIKTNKTALIEGYNKEYYSVELPEDDSAISYKIIDLVGRTVHYQQATGKISKNLAAGVYILQIETTNGRMVSKKIVSRN